tara:strand:+ start:20970 stop:21365 length:396 start_codon:yes stop_codon:yes gene_type:complete
MATTSNIRCSTRDIKTVKITGLAAGGATQGAWIYTNNFFGMWLTDRDSDSEAVLMYDARKVNVVIDTAIMTAGDSLYWHITNAEMVPSAAQVLGPVATLLENKAAGTLDGDVDLRGSLMDRQESFIKNFPT